MWYCMPSLMKTINCNSKYYEMLGHLGITDNKSAKHKRIMEAEFAYEVTWLSRCWSVVPTVHPEPIETGQKK